MRTSICRVVATLKSGIRRIRSFVRENKKAICKCVGKLVLFLIKTIIEVFLQDLL